MVFDLYFAFQRDVVHGTPISFRCRIDGHVEDNLWNQRKLRYAFEGSEIERQILVELHTSKTATYMHVVINGVEQI
jgi:hypothetical protein